MNASSAARADSLLPVPAALVTYRTASGRPGLAPASWTAIVCRRSATLSAALGPGAEFPGGDFVVNLLSDEMLASSAFLASLARHTPLVELVENRSAGLPRVAGSQAYIECVNGVLRGGILRGRVAAVPGMPTISPAELLMRHPFSAAFPAARPA